MSHDNIFREVPIGGTFFGGNTVDSTSGAHLEGAEVEIELRQWNQNPAMDYGVHAGGKVRLKCVRNGGTIAVLPGRIVQFKTGSGLFGSQIDSYPTTTAAAWAGVVDPYLPSAGCPVNDLCWIVIEGPCPVLTALTANEDDVFSGGSALVAITAATSQATTAGRLQPQAITATATALLADQLQNRVGRAISASTTAETNTSKLIYLRGGF